MRCMYSDSTERDLVTMMNPVKYHHGGWNFYKRQLSRRDLKINMIIVMFIFYRSNCGSIT